MKLSRLLGVLWLGAVIGLAGCAQQAVPVTSVADTAQPTVVVATITPEPAASPTAVLATSTSDPTALPTATALPAATATLPPTALPTATATPEPPTATPEPPTATPEPTQRPVSVRAAAGQPIQLTGNGCCTQPFWSPDGQQVRFIDKPAADQPVGIWGVNIAAPLSAAQFVTDRLAESSASPLFIIETGGDATIIERRATGERWTVAAAQGRNVQISPDQARIAWTITNSDAPSSDQVTAIWIADLDGGNARQIATLPRGGLSGWINNDTLLISGRDSQTAREQVVSTYSLVDGARVELIRSERLRGTSLSPSGQWLIYYLAFDPDRSLNGLWLTSADGTQTTHLDDALFGSYQWRPCGERCSAAQDRLLIVPFQPDTLYHTFLEFNPNSGAVRPLTDPATSTIKIANADWRVAPDGGSVVYVENRDRNLWLLPLPER